MTIALWVIALLLLLMLMLLVKVVRNHAQAETEKVRLLSSIHHDLDRIGSIMRQDQTERSKNR